MSVIEVKVEIDPSQLQTRLENLINDDETMYQLHDALARFCNPYVPMDTGTLAQTTQITPEHVRYTQPYAHYQYMGELYLAANGSSWAKKDEHKYPSGKPLHYSKEAHELASKEWDKAMLSDRREEFTQEVMRILVERAKALYG